MLRHANKDLSTGRPTRWMDIVRSSSSLQLSNALPCPVCALRPPTSMNQYGRMVNTSSSDFGGIHEARGWRKIFCHSVAKIFVYTSQHKQILKRGPSFAAGWEELQRSIATIPTEKLTVPRSKKNDRRHCLKFTSHVPESETQNSVGSDPG